MTFRDACRITFSSPFTRWSVRFREATALSQYPSTQPLCCQLPIPWLSAARDLHLSALQTEFTEKFHRCGLSRGLKSITGNGFYGKVGSKSQDPRRGSRTTRSRNLNGQGMVSRGTRAVLPQPSPGSPPNRGPNPWHPHEQPPRAHALTNG